MVKVIPEFNVTRIVCLRLATIGVLAIALPLAACGRKGALDPPPGGMVLESRPGQTPVTSRGLRPAREQRDDEGRPIAPAGPKQRHPLDWLID
jgi:predicted small lipoprotein YifL